MKHIHTTLIACSCMEHSDTMGIVEHMSDARVGVVSVIFNKLDIVLGSFCHFQNFKILIL